MSMIDLEIEEQSAIDLEVSEIIIDGDNYDDYTGETTVTPTESEQTLGTAGKLVRSDITVEPIPDGYIVPSGTKLIGAGGSYDVKEYASARVLTDIQPLVVTPSEEEQTYTFVETTPQKIVGFNPVTVGAIPSEYVVPEGTATLTANGTYDVSDKQTAEVAIPEYSGPYAASINADLDELPLTLETSGKVATQDITISASQELQDTVTDYGTARTVTGVDANTTLTDGINALTTYANEVTSGSDTTLSEAVATLAAGYGQGGGDTVYCGSYGALYTVDTVTDSTRADTGFRECEYLETITHSEATSVSLYAGGFNCVALKSVTVPKCATYPNYFIRQQGSSYCNLESVTLGSIGYPVTNLTGANWRYGCHAATLTVTIYVDATILADIPTAVSSYAEGNDIYAPSGSTVTVVYKNSTTGEAITE